MEKNIIALLNTNLRVIIPDFGAFIIRQNEPKIIVFNEFLRYNDGFLIGYITKTEGIEREIAQMRVLNFVEEGTKILDSGKPFIINGLGILQKDNSGKISFTAEEDLLPVIQFDDMSSEKLPEKIKDLKKKKVTVRKTPVSKTAIKGKTNIKSVQKVKRATAGKAKSNTPSREMPVTDEAATEKQLVEKRVVEQTPIEPPANEPHEVEPTVINLSVNEQFHNEQPVSEPAADGPPDPVIPVTESPLTNKKFRFANISILIEPNRINQILLWVLLILFVNAAILAWFVFKDDVRTARSVRNSPELISDSVFQALSDSVRMIVAEDPTLIFNEDEGMASGDEPADGHENEKYYIVAGCFREEANANVLVLSLKDLGYNAEKFGIIGNLHAVSYASFSDKEMAVKELQHIRETVPDAWMTRF
jgi:hypothetical protein